MKLLLTTLCLTLPACAALAAPAAKPNIVYIFSDDHAVQAIGACNGRLAEFCRQQGVTPNIDRLAASGALFTNSFCGNSICSPSRASVLTGLHSHANGVPTLGGSLKEGVWTFPRGLREGGYQTALFGKWHLGNRPDGMDEYQILSGQGKYWNPMFADNSGKISTVEGYATDIISRKSLDWLDRRDKSRPFLLLCHHKAPHRPFSPPARYFGFLNDVEVPEPETLFDDYGGNRPAARVQTLDIATSMNLPVDLKVLPHGKTPADLPPSQAAAWLEAFGARNDAFMAANLQGRELLRWKYQQYAKDYLRCIKAVDDSVGEILGYLEHNGLAENTIVIYSSDQGFYIGEHGWFDKRWIYEESLRMPLIVRWPGVTRAGARIDAMVQNIDHAPTLMEMAGLGAPEGLHGRSLAALLRGQSPAGWRQAIYYRYNDPGHGVSPHCGIRTARHTLAFFPKQTTWELYDLEQDPHQLRNIHSEASPELIQALHRQMESLREQYGVPENDLETGGHRAGKPGKSKKTKRGKS
jgi:N-acetylglucosamine-6-sulfatase